MAATPRPTASRRLPELEAVRGLAAFGVVTSHFFGAFPPWEYLPRWLAELLSAATNTSSVVVFFVLSGFVLPLNYLHSLDTNTLAAGAIKRWPRLLFLVFVGTMASYLLFVLGINFANRAAVLSGSDWLSRELGLGDRNGFHADLATALRQGLFGTFFENRSGFNISFWTMYHELFGSFVSLALAAALAKAPPRAMAAAVALALVATEAVAWRLVPFVVGTTLAVLYVRWPRDLSRGSAWSLAVLGCYLYGYRPGKALYAPIDLLLHGAADEKVVWLVHVVAGSLILISVHGGASIRRALNAPMLRFLGRISFPVYAIHLPLIGCIASGAYLLFYGALGKGPAIVSTLAVFLPVLILVAYWLALGDEAWNRWLNRKTRAMFSAAPARGPGAAEKSADLVAMEAGTGSGS